MEQPPSVLKGTLSNRQDKQQRPSVRNLECYTIVRVALWNKDHQKGTLQDWHIRSICKLCSIGQGCDRQK